MCVAAANWRDFHGFSGSPPPIPGRQECTGRHIHQDLETAGRSPYGDGRPPLGGVHGGSLAGFDFGGIFRVIDVWICLDMFGIILQDAQVIDIARFWDVLVGITLQHQQSKQNQVFLP